MDYSDYLKVLQSSAKAFNNESDDVMTGRNAIRDSWRKWPGAVIPYVISNVYNSRERGIIAKAFREYHTKTCIK